MSSSSVSSTSLILPFTLYRLKCDRLSYYWRLYYHSIAATILSTYFLLPESAVLQASYKNYQQVAKSPSSTVRELSIAQAAENRHRINCFAKRCRSFVRWCNYSNWDSWNLYSTPSQILITKDAATNRTVFRTSQPLT